jgi:UDP-N-acetylglucosamine 1-carboxyvinyltransferase
MGAQVTGAGSHTIRIEPPARLGGAVHTLRGDYIEAGSWAVVGAVTGGEVEVTGAAAQDLEPIAAILSMMNVNMELSENRLAVRPSNLVAARRIVTGLWPGFPSDIVSLVTVLATQARGRTLLHDWMYELRLFALEQLSSMRADLFLCDPHRIIVTGPTKLRGRLLDSRDIRSGMALVAAALAADGQSTVLEIETVERGYASLVERLQSLGAQVERN